MTRSIWKGPFVEKSLLKKVAEAMKSKKNKMVKTYSRRSTILPDFVNITLAVYNGKKFIPVLVTEDMVGHKLGEFSPTRTMCRHGDDRKKAKKR